MSDSNNDKEKRKEDKKNTDVWKLKQEEKKRKKEQEQAEGGGDQGEKKEKKDKKDKKDKKAKKQEAAQQPLPQPQPKQEVVQEKVTYHPLTSVTQRLDEHDHQAQEELILKYMDQLTSPHDVVLYLGQRKWEPPCQQVHIPGYNKCSKAEIVCQFPDITYLLESTLTKVFIQAKVIFGNGSVLSSKAALTIALLADYYRIPVVVCGGSWNYNGWAPLNESALTDKYGQGVLQEMDFIEAKYVTSTVLEVGLVSPGQVSVYPPLVYKQLRKENIDW